MGRLGATSTVRGMRFAPLALVVGACVAMAAISPSAKAAIHHRRWSHTSSVHVRHWIGAHSALKLTEPDKDAALIVDGETGKPLYARNADALRHPASLTKMMTLYLLFEQLKSGQMTLATPLYVSEHAAVQARTKLYLHAGATIPVDTAIKAIVVLSANDVAVTIAEAIGGSEQHFAQLMTAKARALGMSNTWYDNASGLPDPLQITTANDLGILARRLAYDFPQYFHYFSTYTFDFRGATYFTHDNLIGRYDGADGIKTGYTNASGFNLVSSVVRNGVHIIGVVMGGTTARRRDAQMVQLLDDAFAAVGKNPQLVAHTEIPWQAVAQNGVTRPVIAGFELGGSGSVLPSVPSQSGQAQNLPGDAGQGDEDSAESRPDPLLDSVIAASREPRESAVQPVTAPAAPPRAKAQAPTVVASLPIVDAKPDDSAGHDTARAAPAQMFPIPAPSDVPVPQPKPHLALANYAPMPGVNPKPRTQAADVPAAPASNSWTVQIGAFADAALARAKLNAYAEHSSDLLGQSSRIVAPFVSNEGHTLFRARFGPFAEREARQICEVLTERGQTCFAALAAQ